MKHIFIMLVCFFTSLQFYAQKTTYTGTIITPEKAPINGATISIINSESLGIISDINGNFTIETTNIPPNISISYMGFVSQKITLKEKHTIIQLEPSNTMLEEVVISASREQQKRIEVPAAITVITAKDIKESKPFGIDQIINRVPGVLMATSRAASNEQHFTATRSPISTKSLFLYIEDGIPIRPTAVFNHNALLEINTTSINRVEVLKGPASSIYGSEAIGGSFNFITKNPTAQLSGSISTEINDIGLSKVAAEVSTYTNDTFGFYLGTHYVQRNNGPIDYSDYEKFAATFKTVYHVSSSLSWTNVFDLIDYRSDMTGSLTEANYTNGNYLSSQTFTQRDALSFRFRSSFHKKWNHHNKTTFNFVFRDNKMDQNPSYRIRQFRSQGQLTGSGSGEVNSNQFQSLVGLIQHKLDFNFAKSSLITGVSIDYSPQDYIAQRTAVMVNTNTGQNTSFSINSNDFILDYEANIFNYAGYFQYEISPITPLKITAALRYDAFKYDYNNRADGIVGAQDQKTSYTNIAPKLGINYNFSKTLGLYANYSNGFSPPQTSSLYRNRFVGVDGVIFDLKPSRFDNYEIGGYFNLKKNLKVDVAFYQLEGKNRLVTLRNGDDTFYNTNAGRTRSYGIEYGVQYQILPGLEISHNGSYSQHRYIDFVDRDTDYSHTDIPTAPSIIGLSAINYNFKLNKKLNVNLSLEHELMGAYNTSFENQVVTEVDNVSTFSTATYKGHNILNSRITFGYKNLELWGHLLNILDDLYAVRVSYSSFRKENSYTIGNPRAFHLGLKYNF